MQEKEISNLKRGIVLVFIANLINLAISLINGFVLPKNLSVETYADIKTYQLYAGYIGVLVLGYSDGIYLKYGGRKIGEVLAGDINTIRANLIVFQSITTVLFITLAGLLQNKILMLTALSIVPVNIAATFKCILQATGEFKAYSSIMNFTSILNFAGTMLLIFVLHIDYGIPYISLMVAVTFVVWLLFEYRLLTTYHYTLGFKVSFKDIFENIRSGIVLMLGNFSSIMMTSIDRWFVKGLLTTTSFAYYSFVVSTENLVAVFITPVVTTMYNYICVTSDYLQIRKIKRMCMIFALFLISGAFPIKFILEVYLTKYIESKYVLFILFSTEVLYMVIKGIYVNIYKARKQQKQYLFQLLGIIVLGCVLNAIFYKLMGNNEGIALATLISVIAWYVVCSATVKEIRPDFKEIVMLATGIIAFILLGFMTSAILGFVIYVFLIMGMSYLFMWDELMAVFKTGTGFIRKKLHK